MDFFTKKELNGLKGDLKASEIAIKASNEDFKKKLIEQYGKEINFGFVNQTYIPPQPQPPLVFEVKESQKESQKETSKEKKKTCWLRKLFSI